MGTDKDLDGWRKNLQEVSDGLALAQEEWAEAASKVADAWKQRDIPDLLHHLSDFRGAAQQHGWKLWFYTFWPKWILVAVLVWAT